MITKHHIELIQVSNSLDLKMTTGPLCCGVLEYNYKDITISLSQLDENFFLCMRILLFRLVTQYFCDFKLR